MPRQRISREYKASAELGRFCFSVYVALLLVRFSTSCKFNFIPPMAKVHRARSGLKPNLRRNAANELRTNAKREITIIPGRHMRVKKKCNLFVVLCVYTDDKYYLADAFHSYYQ